MKNKRGKSQKVQVDETIMKELLEQPGVKENVAQMTPEYLTWFKELLVSQGVYARYVTERKAKELTDGIL